MNALMLVAGVLVPIFVAVLFIIVSVVTFKRRRVTNNGKEEGSTSNSPVTHGWQERFNKTLSPAIVVLGYLSLLFMLSLLFPPAWNWYWQQQAFFWASQGAVVLGLLLLWTRTLLGRVIAIGVFGILVAYVVLKVEAPEYVEGTTPPIQAAEPESSPTKPEGELPADKWVVALPASAPAGTWSKKLNPDTKCVQWRFPTSTIHRTGEVIQHLPHVSATSADEAVAWGPDDARLPVGHFFSTIKSHVGLRVGEIRFVTTDRQQALCVYHSQKQPGGQCREQSELPPPPNTCTFN